MQGSSEVTNVKGHKPSKTKCIQINLTQWLQHHLT